MNIGGAHPGVRGHRNSPPNPSSTVPHLLLQLDLGRSIALVLRSDILERRPNKLAIHRMATHARISLSHLQPIRHGSKSRRSEPKTSPSNDDPGNKNTNKTPHHNAPAFPGRVAEEFVTGAGAWCSIGCEVTPESGTAPTVGASAAGAAAGALAAAAVVTAACCGSMY